MSSKKAMKKDAKGAAPKAGGRKTLSNMNSPKAKAGDKESTSGGSSGGSSSSSSEEEDDDEYPPGSAAAEDMVVRRKMAAGVNISACVFPIIDTPQESVNDIDNNFHNDNMNNIEHWAFSQAKED